MEYYRIVQYLSLCGICSRRKAKYVIEDKRVTINGELCQNLSVKVSSNDIITVDGKEIKADEDRIILLNKPIDYVCSHSDKFAKNLIFDLLPKKYANFHIIGRLDKNTTGLLLLTNNQQIKKYFEDPENNIPRIYKVKIFGKLDMDKLKQIENGIVFNNIKYKKCKVEILSQSQNNHILQFTLYEGRNREIRNMMLFLKVKIAYLHRVKFGNYMLENIKKASYKILAKDKFLH